MNDIFDKTNKKGFKMKKIIQALVMILIAGNLTYADCYYNGRTYPEGATIGSLICVNGSWIRR